MSRHTSFLLIKTVFKFAQSFTNAAGTMIAYFICVTFLALAGSLEAREKSEFLSNEEFVF